MIIPMVSREEKLFLRRLLDSPRPIAFPIELIYVDADDKTLHKLVSQGYITEIQEPAMIGGGTSYFYKLSDKAYAEFRPWWQKAWGFFTNDMAKVLSVLALLISILVGLRQIGWL